MSMNRAIHRNDMCRIASCRIVLATRIHYSASSTETPDVDSAKRKAGETGEFDLRGAVGQAFYHAHKPGSASHDEYALCKSRLDRANFRKALRRS